jgi:hypothetical protein
MLGAFLQKETCISLQSVGTSVKPHSIFPSSAAKACGTSSVEGLACGQGQAKRHVSKLRAYLKTQYFFSSKTIPWYIKPKNMFGNKGIRGD